MSSRGNEFVLPMMPYSLDGVIRPAANGMTIRENAVTFAWVSLIGNGDAYRYSSEDIAAKAISLADALLAALEPQP